MRIFIGRGLLLLAFTCLSGASHAAEPKYAGWHIRICPQHTKADSVVFRLSYGEHPPTDWWEWRRDRPTEKELPVEYAHAWRVRVWAYGHRRQVDFCLGYRDHIVRHYSFDKEEEATVNQEDTNGCPC